MARYVVSEPKSEITARSIERGTIRANSLTTGTLRIPGAQVGHLTKEECVEQGGHCFEAEMLRLGDGSHYEQCKHCPARRRAIPQPPFRYEEA